MDSEAWVYQDLPFVHPDADEVFEVHNEVSTPLLVQIRG